MSDFGETLHSARQGDAQAQQTLFERWRPLLQLQAAQELGGRLQARIDSADVVQEALTQASLNLASFRGSSEMQFVAWLRTLVVGHAAKARRHHQADKRSIHREVNPQDDFEETLALNITRTPEQQIMEYEQAARLAAAIQTLPDNMQEVIVRRVFHQQPWSEVAESLDKTSGAARVLWTRAIQKLRELLPE